MTKFFSVVIACVALACVASAQGTSGNQSGAQGNPNDKSPNKHGRKKFETMAEKIKRARKNQSEDTHLRVKLGLLGLNSMAAGITPGTRSTAKHGFIEEQYGMSAVSKMSRDLRRSMISGYQSQSTIKLLEGQISADMTMLQKLKTMSLFQTRITGTRSARLSNERKARDARAAHVLKAGNLKAFADMARAKGYKLAPGAVGSIHSINPATLRGTSTQPDTSSITASQSVYQSAAAFGSTAGAKAKVKAALQGGQSSPGNRNGQNGQTGHSSQGSTYKNGN